VFLQTGPDFGVAALGNADYVLAGPLGLTALLFDFYKLFGLGVAYGALCGGIGTFVYITAHQASEFLVHISVI
jgi:hypothetical protein